MPLELNNQELTSLKHTRHNIITTEAVQSFRVSVKRADKRFPLTSMEVEREIGQYLCDITGKNRQAETAGPDSRY